MSFFAKLFGLNQKTTAQEDVALKAAQELESSNETSFIELIKNRRSIYAIGNNLNQSNDEIEKLIQEAIRHSPSAFNSQSSRAVILFGQSHHKFWDTVLEVLKSIVPAEAVLEQNKKFKVLLLVQAQFCFMKIRTWLKVYKNSLQLMLIISRSGQSIQQQSHNLRSGTF